MKKTTYILIKDTDLYKRYRKRVVEIEKNMTNRTPLKIGLYCRWIKISGKRGNNNA